MTTAKRDPFKLVGTRLDRYMIQEVAGSGGMGYVYRAQHEFTKGTVAIKVLRPDIEQSNQSSVSMFFEEAVKTVQLNHPFIVKVVGADYTPEGLSFMVMEWLDGQTLSEEMEKEGAFPVERVADLLDQICDAVAYAHNKNILHRDLKPGNIMLVCDERSEETIRVLDFGIAKAMANTVATNTTIAGSCYYISPEQTIAHGRIDRCTDIYSIGVMLYQMLTGKVPFDADTGNQIMDMHRSLDPAPLRQINPSIPVGIEEVVLKAMAKQPGNRYQNATDLTRAFRQAAQLASGLIVLECVDDEDDSPAGAATIYLNGKHVGQTDENGYWQQAGLTPRNYLIEVEALRYMRWHVSEGLSARKKLTIQARLKRQSKGELVISCGVEGVGVELDGRKIGKTDRTGRLYLDSVDAGSHAVKLTHPKYLPAESIVEIAIWQQSLCEMTLTEYVRFQSTKRLWRKITGSESNAGESAVGASRQPGVVKTGSLPTPKYVETDPQGVSTPTEVSRAEDSSRSGSMTSLETCEICRAQIPNGVKFCIECGRPIASIVETRGGEKNVEVPVAQNSDPSSTRKETIVVKAPSISASDLAPLADVAGESLPYATLPSMPGSRETSKWKWAVIIPVVVAVVLGAAYIAWKKDQATQPIAEPMPTPLVSPTLNPTLPPEGMVYIPGGEFQMGDPKAPQTDAAWPPHSVQIKPFFIGKHEVTREEYLKCIQAKVCKAPSSWNDGKIPAGTESLPVTDVSWNDANTYLKWKGEQDPQFSGLRLPTEAEWEFVARDGKDQRFPWGDGFNPDLANAGEKSSELKPVESYPLGANQQFKVYDLIGNVFEWTQDEFRAYEGSRFILPGDCQPCRVIRGGAYGFSPDDEANAYYRGGLEPGGTYDRTGFRAAKSVPNR